MRTFPAAVLVALLAAPPARADDAGVWANQQLTLDLKRPGRTTGPELWLDFHQRSFGPTFVGVVRPGVGYDVGHGVTVWVGYAFVASFLAGASEPPRLEHRVWEQLLATEKVGPITLQQRLRVEHRFLQDADGVGARARLLARVGVPFTRSSRWGWAAMDELMLNLVTTEAWKAGFDQNRAFTGPYYQADDGVRVEVGYLNVMAVDPEDGEAFDHAAMVNLTVPLRAFPGPGDGPRDGQR